MAIDSINSLASPRPAAVDTSSTNQAMGRDAFMKLLVAQLKNQDPLNPLDAREFVTQLSQLTSVEQQVTMTQRMEALEIATAGMANTQAANLIGRTVTANANAVNLQSEGTATGSFSLTGAAANVKIRVLDSTGRVVREIEQGAVPPGPHEFTWDGNDADGTRVSEGRYRFEVIAKDAAGHPVEVQTKRTGVVTDVSYEHGYPELVVDGSRLMLGDVVSISR